MAEPAPLRMTNATEDLARLYPWLDAAAREFDLAPKLLNGMHVALEEAVMNVAMHGYGDVIGEILVRLRVEKDEAVLTVEDHGPPFDPAAAPQNASRPSLDDSRPGGLGLKLLRHFCQDISYASEADRNFLTLRFPIQA